MAKKKTAKEPCMFCGYNPCQCSESADELENGEQDDEA